MSTVIAPATKTILTNCCMAYPFNNFYRPHALARIQFVHFPNDGAANSRIEITVAYKVSIISEWLIEGVINGRSDRVKLKVADFVSKSNSS